MPIPSYAEAVRYVRRQPRINTSTLADGLGIRWSLALDYLERMERSRVVGTIQDDGWWPVARVEGPPAARKPSTSSPGKGTVLSRGNTAARGAPPETLNLAAPANPASDPDQQ